MHTHICIYIGDYESLLKLWEDYIVQPSLVSMPEDLIYEGNNNS
jgi:hypothetical protein